MKYNCVLGFKCRIKIQRGKIQRKKDQFAKNEEKAAKKREKHPVCNDDVTCKT